MRCGIGRKHLIGVGTSHETALKDMEKHPLSQDLPPD
jgi:hypothetical protein